MDHVAANVPEPGPAPYRPSPRPFPRARSATWTRDRSTAFDASGAALTNASRSPRPSAWLGPSIRRSAAYVVGRALARSTASWS